MPQYLSPGVYVEEVPSAIKPIAGVSTSTAAFIGVIPDSISVPPSFPVVDEKVIADGTGRLLLEGYPAATEKGTFNVRIPDSTVAAASIENSYNEKKSYVRLAVAPESADQIVATYNYWVEKKIDGPNLTGTTDKQLDLDALFQTGEAKPASTEEGSYQILRSNQEGQRSPIAGATLNQTATGGKFSVQFTGDPDLKNDSVILRYKLQAQNEKIGEGKKDGKTVVFDLANKGAVADEATVTVNDKPAVRQGAPAQGDSKPAAEFEITGDQSGSQITVRKYPEKKTEVSVDYLVGGPVKGQMIRALNPGQEYAFDLCDHPVLTEAPMFQVWVGDKPVASVSIEQKTVTTPARIKFVKAPEGNIRADYVLFASFKPADVGKPVLCTSFSEYKRNFGDFSIDPMHNRLTHAVYGFFNNGGTRCYVVRAKDATPTSIEATFDALDRIEDISIVAAPGMDDDGVRGVIVARCKNKGDRFAIFDGPEKATDLNSLIKIKDAGGVMPGRTDGAAWYFPWIKVFDPVAKMLNPAGDGAISVPPSGHIAGVYARVDAQRGVHKAPANEPILGALGVAQPLSKAEQDGLNPKGVNCIRIINDNIMVWGARTIGGDGNTDLKYINVKRTLLFLKKSIYEGTQWVVFEPNSPALWQTITRNVTAFLTAVWRSGALFGNTPQEAFYVKCDAETNTKEARENGQVIAEIGVAIVRPAEFVIFRISQWQGPGQ